MKLCFSSLLFTLHVAEIAVHPAVALDLYIFAHLLLALTTYTQFLAGIHTVRIKYDPNFDEKEVPHPSFQVSGFTPWFLNVRTVP